MKNISIEERQVGPEQPCFIIAEACDNHLGSLDTAREMISQARLAGADAIKFQHHLPEEEMLPDVPMSTNFNMPLFEFLKRYALTLQQHEQLMVDCQRAGIIYMCTPFSWKAAWELNEIGLGAFKIGSGELTDIPSLKKIAGLGKPMILSTGMAYWEEIDETVNALRPLNANLVLLNCISEYPAKHEDVNLRVIPAMEERYQLIIGHSDHTPDIHTSIAAVALGAKVVEKHFILDKRQPGPDQSVSIDPAELHELVVAIRRVEAALGDQKTLHDQERPIREWAHRSVVSIQDIAEGQTITEEHVWTKRPGTGIPSKQLDEVLGKTAVRAIATDTLLSWEDLR